MSVGILVCVCALPLVFEFVVSGNVLTTEIIREKYHLLSSAWGLNICLSGWMFWKTLSSRLLECLFAVYFLVAINRCSLCEWHSTLLWQCFITRLCFNCRTHYRLIWLCSKSSFTSRNVLRKLRSKRGVINYVVSQYRLKHYFWRKPQIF